jgi:hypothetical protein
MICSLFLCSLSVIHNVIISLVILIPFLCDSFGPSSVLADPMKAKCQVRQNVRKRHSREMRREGEKLGVLEPVIPSLGKDARAMFSGYCFGFQTARNP